MRGADIAAKSWDIQPHGLAAFDAHTQTGVFASSSAISPTHWKTQRVSVHSTDRGMNLSSATISTGLASFPIRPLPSPSIPRSSSLVFHPIEMLYGIGEPDGTSEYLCHKVRPSTDCRSSCHGLQVSASRVIYRWVLIDVTLPCTFRTALTDYFSTTLSAMLNAMNIMNAIMEGCSVYYGPWRYTTFTLPPLLHRHPSWQRQQHACA